MSVRVFLWVVFVVSLAVAKGVLAFQQEDIALVEYCAALVGQFLEKLVAREYTSKEGTKTAAAISSSSKS